MRWLVLLIVWIVIVSGCVSTPTEETTTLLKSRTETRFHKVNEPVDCPNIPLRITIKSVEYPERLMFDDGREGDKPAEGKMFVMLDVLLENTDDTQPVNVMVRAFSSLQDGEGYTYTPEQLDWLAWGDYNEFNGMVQGIDWGMKERGQLLFEVPKNAKELVLTYGCIGSEDISREGSIPLHFKIK